MKLARIDIGIGMPVVLLHGIGNSKNIIDPFYDILSGSGYRVIAFDLPGHGDSGVLENVGPGNVISAIGDSVMDNLRELGIEKFALVGISFGGAIAMNIAGRYPESVRALVLQGAPVYGREIGFIKRLVFKFIYRFSKYFNVAKVLYFFANSTAPFVEWAKGVHGFSVALEKVKNNYTRVLDIDFWALCVRALMDIDARKALKEFHNSILLVDGSLPSFKFTDTTFKLAKLIFKNKNGGALEISLFPDAGHDLPETKPRKFAERVLGFLNRDYGKA